MATFTISVNDEIYELIKSFQQHLFQQGKHYSISRVIGYAVGYIRQVQLGAATVSQMKDGLAKLQAFESLLIQAGQATPSQKPRGGRRPCYTALPGERAEVVHAIVTRLGIANPPKELVDAYLDQGGMDPMIGSKIHKLDATMLTSREGEAEARKVLEESKASQAKLAEKVEEDLNPPLQNDEPPAPLWRP